MTPITFWLPGHPTTTVTENVAGSSAHRQAFFLHLQGLAVVVHAGEWS